MTKTFSIRGQKIRSASQRRYIVVACRPADFVGQRWDYRVEAHVPETYKAFTAHIVRRSDSLQVARAAARKVGFVAGGWIVIVDQTTGEEVAS